jgi:hypothetical protein
MGNRELAELLGQVKPPTVSKEEIEKSGLEILKPAILEQYEKDGKVSSNCTEKASTLCYGCAFVELNLFLVSHLS